MKKRDDFKNQQMVVLPRAAIEVLKNNTFTQYLYLTDIGIFPKAIDHYRYRKQGSSQYILLLCTEGVGWVECNGVRSKVEKNQFYIIPPHISHKYFAHHTDPWTIYWIHFSGTLANYFSAPFQYPKHLPQSKTARFEDRITIFQELITSLVDFSVSNLEYSSVLLTHFLGSLKYVSQYRKFKEIQAEDAISITRNYILQNLDRKITLQKMAQHCNLSVSHLSMLFKKETSYSPMQYVTMLRVRKACTLLTLSAHKINYIAKIVGFEDAYYFTRVFAKTMGQSPSKYRKMSKG